MVDEFATYGLGLEQESNRLVASDALCAVHS